MAMNLSAKIFGIIQLVKGENIITNKIKDTLFRVGYDY
jgi:hypothetical protein